MSKHPVANLLSQARSLAGAHRLDEADALYREALRVAPDTLEALDFLAAMAMRRQRFDEAVSISVRCLQLQPGQPQRLFNLATALEQRGDLALAIDAYLSACRLSPGDAVFALFAGAALAAAQRDADAAVMFSLADGNDPGLLPGRDNPRLNPEIRRRAELANRAIRQHFHALHQQAVDEVELAYRQDNDTAADLSRLRNAVWVQTHPEPVAFRTPLQRPGIFYLPDLPPMPVVPRTLLPWAERIEAATGLIRDEYLAAIAAGTGMAPYVEDDVQDPVWQALRGRPDWSSLHLFKAAQEQPAARLFPQTLRSIAEADIFRVGHTTPMEVFFSRLAPGTHIPPHFGVANQRLTVHLPLIVPTGCSIRIGDSMHDWRVGEIFAFDDSFEHEAWNRGDSERVVLIFETHHPDLRPEERQTIEHSYDRRGRWLRERSIPVA
jgi:aspartate beta-hydroxylase